MPLLTRQEAEEILYEEARALDELRYDDWLAMLTADALYWMPCRADADPNREVSLVYDNVPRLQDRIARLATGIAHAQSPPSKTARLISNVQVSPAGEGDAKVRSTFLLYELRRGKQRVFGGHCEHRLRFDDRWKITLKRPVLVNAAEVIDNLTFIV
jgi:3-phenylpropionate/cinnamic acid dioxygenase small subunit